MGARSRGTAASQGDPGPTGLLELVRWRNWRSKLPAYLVAMSYSGLRAGAPGPGFLLQVSGLGVLLVALACSGHIANDLSDREVDARVGKSRPAARMGRAQVVLLLAGLAGAVLAIAALGFGAGTAAWAAAALVAGYGYSLPPLRFKERGGLGVLAGAIAQRTLAVGIVFQALRGWDAGAVAFALHGTFMGLRFMLLHQLSDRESDLVTGIRTVATRETRERLEGWITRVLAPLEVAAIGATLAWTVPRAPLGVALALGLAYLGRRGSRLPALSYGFLGELYHLGLPIGLALALTIREPAGLVLLATALALAASVEDYAFYRVFGFLGARPPPPRPPPDPGDSVSHRDVPEVLDLQVDPASPHPELARLRRQTPVVRGIWKGLGPGWLVFRHAQGRSLLADPRFRAAPGTAAPGDPPRVSSRGFGPDMLEADGADHARLRGVLAEAFQRPRLESLTPRIEALCNRILDGLPRGEVVDLIPAIARRLPIQVIVEFLGLPTEDPMALQEFALGVARRPGSPEEAEALERARTGFRSLVDATCEARLREPRDDLVTRIARAREQGVLRTSEEVHALAFLMVVAGVLTTNNLIGNGLLALAGNPEVRAQLCADPDLAPSMVEEVLRLDPPLWLSSAHHPSEDVEVGGAVLARGEPVRIVVPSANRDPEAFPDPDTFDLGRRPNPHLTFGHGPHFCLGAPLARLEGTIVLGKVAARFPDLALAVPEARLPHLDHPFARGLESLPVRI